MITFTSITFVFLNNSTLLQLSNGNSTSFFGHYISHIVNREYPVLPQSSLTSYVTSTARRVLDIAKLTSKAQ